MTALAAVRGGLRPSRDPDEITTSIGGFRPDIEGLRAVAVILVILDHLNLYPHGGFIGVDVFFVISGFLITGLLLKEISTNGRISYLNFYKRRARRILPAGITVLVFVWFMSDALFKGIRVSDTHTDVWWALGFSANIHFAHIGTDYFQANRPVSPVQHYWSLAVEEQFYVVWPLVMLVVFGMGRRFLKAQAVRTAFLGIVTIAVAASFLWAVHETHTTPTNAYFSTFVRAWELGVGALAAVAAARFPGLPDRIGRARGPLVAAGLLGIIASAVLVKSSPGFPAPAAAAPVLCTALIIVAGMGSSPTGRWSYALTNPVSGYVGRISYSLYLWHYPVIVFAAALVPANSGVYRPLTIFGMIGLSVFSYHYVETPFRTPINLRDKIRRPPWRLQRTADLSRHWPVVLGAAGCLMLGLFAYDLKPGPLQPAFLDVAAPAAAAQTVIPADVARPTPALSKAIAAALDATSFPKLEPSLSHLGLTAAETDWNGCRTATAVLASCTFHDPAMPVSSSKVAVLLGDSMMLAWLPAIRAALEPQGWTIIGLAREQCPAADVSTDTFSVNQPTTAAACDRHQAFVLGETRRLHPSLVLLSSSASTTTRLNSRATGAEAIAQYEAGMVATERAVHTRGTDVVTLAPPPSGHDLAGCDTATATPIDCESAVPPIWFSQSSADSAAATSTGTTYLDTHLWFCSTNYACPAFVRTTPIYYDGAHLTKAYSTMLGVQLANALKL